MSVWAFRQSEEGRKGEVRGLRFVRMGGFSLLFFFGGKLLVSCFWGCDRFGPGFGLLLYKGGLRKSLLDKGSCWCFCSCFFKFNFPFWPFGSDKFPVGTCHLWQRIFLGTRAPTSDELVFYVDCFSDFFIGFSGGMQIQGNVHCGGGVTA